MKIFYLIILLTASAHSAHAGWFDDFLANVNVSHLVSSASDFFNKFQDRLNEFTENAKTEIDKIAANVIESAKNAYDNASKEFAKLSIQFSSFEKTLSKYGEEVEKMIPTINDLFNSSEDKVKILLQSINIYLANATEKTVNRILIETTKLEQWANNTMKLAQNSTKKHEAQQIIEEFVKKSSQEIKNCTEQTIKPIQDVNNYANKTATEVIKSVMDLEKMIKQCTEDTNESMFNLIKKCLMHVPGAVKNAGNFINNHIIPVQLKLAELAVTGVVDFSCIISSTVSIDMKKSEIEKKINELATA